VPWGWVHRNHGADVPTSFRYRSPQLHSPCWGLAQGHGPLWGIQPREARGGTITWCSLHSPPRMAPRSWGSTTPTLEVLGVTLLLEYSSHLYRFYRFFRFVVLEYSPVTKQVRRSMGVEVGATTIAFEHGDFSRAALSETKRTSRSEVGGVTSARWRQIGAIGTKTGIRQSPGRRSP